jgi:anti-sigma factor RsiW
MNVVSFNERSCERYRRYFDAYLDNELLVETNQDVLQHLASCTECGRILEDRARVKQLVRGAVKAEEAPADLVVAVRGELGSGRSGFFANRTQWLMAAAVLLLVIGGVSRVPWSSIMRFAGDQGVFQTVSVRVQEILRVGLVDHVHCAILSQRWKELVTFDAMKADSGPQALGSEFIDLVPAVQAKLGAEFKVVQGHRCTANHRQYVHLILTGNKGTILSLVITKKNGESFQKADAVAVMNASGIPIYEDRQGILEIAGFESDKYLAYVVSNLDRAASLDIASQVAPMIYEHLHRLEL